MALVALGALAQSPQYVDTQSGKSRILATYQDTSSMCAFLLTFARDRPFLTFITTITTAAATTSIINMTVRVAAAVHFVLMGGVLPVPPTRRRWRCY